MKTLFIHRHAKSDWGNHNLSDFDRPLNERGLRDAPDMASRLLDRGESIDHIISSPALRAITTARLVSKTLAFSESRIVEDKRIYDARVRDLLQVINETDDRFKSLILFGHNPGLSELTAYLSGMEAENLPTAGIAKISFDTDHWGAVSANTGKLLYIDFPKNQNPI